jgi:hypothetical protein
VYSTAIYGSRRCDGINEETEGLQIAGPGWENFAWHLVDIREPKLNPSNFSFQKLPKSGFVGNRNNPKTPGMALGNSLGIDLPVKFTESVSEVSNRKAAVIEAIFLSERTLWKDEDLVGFNTLHEKHIPRWKAAFSLGAEPFSSLKLLKYAVQLLPISRSGVRRKF